MCNSEKDEWHIFLKLHIQFSQTKVTGQVTYSHVMTSREQLKLLTSGKSHPVSQLPHDRSQYLVSYQTVFGLKFAFNEWFIVPGLPKRTRILLFFFLGVVSPYAVVQAGGEAQPGQVGNHQCCCSAADGIPGHHRGSDGPSEEHQVYQGLVLTEAGEWLRLLLIPLSNWHTGEN